MDPERAVEARRRIPKPVVVAIVVVLAIGALIWVLPVVLFFAFIAMGGQIG